MLVILKSAKLKRQMNIFASRKPIFLYFDSFPKCLSSFALYILGLS